MKIIRRTDDLNAFCAAARKHPFVALDTEFARDRTYFSRLLLMQIAYPGSNDESAALVDVLADELSLDPIIDLFKDESLTKVFHSARQDLEIFYHTLGIFPKPLFDTQIAAMACGYGDQVAYDILAKDIANARIDKATRVTDWSKRPLSKAQMEYALSDVTHLRTIYVKLKKRLESSGRNQWIENLFDDLLKPELYENDPANAWKRIRTRSHSPEFLAIVREVASFREQAAQKNNVPRSWIMRDEAIVELAATKPSNENQLNGLRNFPAKFRWRGGVADLLRAIDRGKNCPKDKLPIVPVSKKSFANNEILALLKVLISAKSKEFGVSQALIASNAELEEFAAGSKQSKLLNGWRWSIFGKDASRLQEGSTALAINNGRIVTVKIKDQAT